MPAAHSLTPHPYLPRDALMGEWPTPEFRELELSTQTRPLMCSKPVIEVRRSGPSDKRADFVTCNAVLFHLWFIGPR